MNRRFVNHFSSLDERHHQLPRPTLRSDPEDRDQEEFTRDPCIDGGLWCHDIL